MNYMQIMEQNLAQLLNQNQSLPQLLESQPTDPFQKRQFGKKMRKSAVNITSHAPTAQHYHSNQVEIKQENNKDMNKFTQMIAINQKHHFKSEQESQLEQRMGEVSILFNKLKLNLGSLQEEYRDKVYNIYKTAGNKRHHEINQLLGNLQGSVEFIIKNCLNLQEAQNIHVNNRQEHSHNHPYHRESKRRRAQCDKQNMRMNYQLVQRSKKRESEHKHIQKQKSIYQAVLEQRQRRAKKKMI